jgi:hypothetical protein
VTDIVIVYDATCPNVDLARQRVRQALACAGLEPRWRELDREDPRTPIAWRDFASPTVLVAGQDVAPAPPGNPACRLYDADGPLTGAPPVDAIVAALRRAQATDRTAQQ